jgi:hypothetical protein
LFHHAAQTRGVAAQVEIDSISLKRFITFQFQELKAGTLSKRVLILSTCTAQPGSWLAKAGD